MLTIIICLVAGAVLGVLADQLLSPPIERWRQRRSIKRALRHRVAADYAGRPLEIDRVDFALHVLFGTLGLAVSRSDVTATLNDTPWRAPADLRKAAAEYASSRGYYDGEVARLNGIEVATYSDARGAEHHRLQLEIVPTGYFDMLATNLALGPFTPVTAPILRGRSFVAETHLSNMIALDLTLVTTDGHVPVFLRSAQMAGLERCWQTSSGETVQLPADLDTSGCPDIFHTAHRGLREELGIGPEQIQDIALTALVATPEFANVGILMFASLAASTEDFEASFNRHVMTARDNWEYTEHDLLSLDDVSSLAHALTDPARRWTKQAAASLVFAHAIRANGNVQPLGEAIQKAGALSLEPGPAERGVLRTSA